MSRNLIFLHIPKAAGSTLRAIIHRQYPDRQVYHISSVSNLHKSIDEFKKLPKPKRRKIRCITGHGVFGLHSHLVGDVEYVTMLRKPVSRVLSNYYYVRRSSTHRLHDKVVRDNISLREYVSDGLNKIMNNQMVRAISESNQKMGKKRLHEAKERIDEHFGVVGLAERFDESVLLMKKHFGWGDVSYRKLNVSSERPGKDSIPGDVRQEIKERNQLDMKLYAYAEERLNENLRQIDRIEQKLRRLRLQCRVRTLKVRLKGVVKQGLSMLGLR